MYNPPYPPQQPLQCLMEFNEMDKKVRVCIAHTATMAVSKLPHLCWAWRCLTIICHSSIKVDALCSAYVHVLRTRALGRCCCMPHAAGFIPQIILHCMQGYMNCSTWETTPATLIVFARLLPRSGSTEYLLRPFSISRNLTSGHFFPHSSHRGLSNGIIKCHLACTLQPLLC